MKLSRRIEIALSIGDAFKTIMATNNVSFHNETTQQNYSGQSALEVTNLVKNKQLGVVEEGDQLKFLLYKFWQTEAVEVRNIAKF